MLKFTVSPFIVCTLHIWTWAYTICYMCARFVCTTFARARLHINIINRVHVFRPNFGFYAYSFLWTTELSYKYADETACRTFFHIKFFLLFFVFHAVWFLLPWAYLCDIRGASLCIFIQTKAKKKQRRHCKWEGNVDFATAVFDFSISNFIHDAQLDEPLAFSKTYIPKNRIERSRKKQIPERKTVSPKGLSLSRWCDLRYCKRSNCVSKDLNVKRIFMCINSYSLSITRRFYTVCTCFGWVGMRILSFLFPLSFARIWFMRQKCIKCYIITTTA